MYYDNKDNEVHLDWTHSGCKEQGHQNIKRYESQFAIPAALFLKSVNGEKEPLHFVATNTRNMRSDDVGEGNDEDKDNDDNEFKRLSEFSIMTKTVDQESGLWATSAYQS
eukprot:Pgem_evm1s5265